MGLSRAARVPRPAARPCAHLGCSPSPEGPFSVPGVPVLGVSVSGSSSALGIGPARFSRAGDTRRAPDQPPEARGMARQGAGWLWGPRAPQGAAGAVPSPAEGAVCTCDILLLGCLPVHYLLVLLLLRGEESREGQRRGGEGAADPAGWAPTLASPASDLRVLFMISSRRCGADGSSHIPLVRGICPKFWAGPLAWGPPPSSATRSGEPPALTFFLSSRSCSSRWKCFSRSWRCRSASSRALASASSLWGIFGADGVGTVGTG